MSTIKSRGIYDMLRLATIKRWAIVEMVRDQSVAEHVYRVWVLAQDLYKIMEDTPHNSFEREDTGFWALVHDMEEVFTGDLPSTVKLVLEEISPGITKKLKEQVLANYFPALSGKMRGLDRTLPAFYVKLADVAESILYVRQYAVNGNQAIEVENSLIETLDKTLVDAADKYRSIPWERARGWIVELLTRPPVAYYRGFYGQ